MKILWKYLINIHDRKISMGNWDRKRSIVTTVYNCWGKKPAKIY
jgi:hypothetical protein